MRPVPASPARGHADMAFTSQWFYFHKDLRKTIPDIFIVYLFGLSRPSRNRCAHFSDQLLIGYVHTHDGIVCAIRQMIKTENVLHCRYKGRILLRWDFPIFALESDNVTLYPGVMTTSLGCHGYTSFFQTYRL